MLVRKLFTPFQSSISQLLPMHSYLLPQQHCQESRQIIVLVQDATGPNTKREALRRRQGGRRIAELMGGRDGVGDMVWNSTIKKIINISDVAHVVYGTIIEQQRHGGQQRLKCKHTRPISKTHGATTAQVPMPENKTYGVLGSGRKVCWISGSTWYIGSSGCWGAGWDSGRYKSNSDWVNDSWLNDPMMRVTRRGIEMFGVGGIETWGRAIFYQDRISKSGAQQRN